MRMLDISKGKFWGLALVVAAIGLVLYKPLVIDNQPAGAVEPTGSLMGGFMAVSILSALTMGIGVAMLVFGGRVVRRLPQDLQRRGHVVRFALFWIIAPWLVHEGLHVTNAHDALGRLLAIEYGFHVTTYAAGIVAAYATATIIASLVGRHPLVEGALPDGAAAPGSDEPSVLA